MDNNYRAFIFVTKNYWQLLICFMIAITALCISLIQYIPLFTANQYIGYILLGMGYALFHFGTKRFLRKRSLAINAILKQELDPELFIQICRKILGELSKKKRDLNLNIHRINLGAGLIASGKYKESVKALSKCGYFGETKPARQTNAIYYFDLCSAYLGLADSTKAMEALESYKTALSGLKLKNGKKSKEYNEAAEYLQYRYALLLGNPDGAALFFKIMFETAENAYNRVIAKFNLGEALLLGGETSRAKEAFEYVVKNGNKLYIVEEAKKRIAAF